jgi:Fe-S-cluster containining protein
VWWEWNASKHFRISLARKLRSDECLFLDGALCQIHESKPLLCKAGPAAWAWMWNPENFWFYVRESPSFGHDMGTFSLVEANHWFMSTWAAEKAVRSATSLAALAEVAQVPESVLQRLTLIEFRKEIH